MTYPRNPAGLNRNEHYMMANNLLFALDEALFGNSRPRATHADPDPLPEDDTTARSHHKGRVYKSVYVGVTTHNNRFVAIPISRNNPAHPLDEAGARLAAVDRAIALERDYLERRDGNHEPLH